jgi:hypothetical protein
MGRQPCVGVSTFVQRQPLLKSLYSDMPFSPSPVAFGTAAGEIANAPPLNKPFVARARLSTM